MSQMREWVARGNAQVSHKAFPEGILNENNNSCLVDKALMDTPRGSKIYILIRTAPAYDISMG